MANAMSELQKIRDLIDGKEVIGYKKIFLPFEKKNQTSKFVNINKRYDRSSRQLIVKLRIPAEARRVIANTFENYQERKCRASFVDVISITDRRGRPYRFGFAEHDGTRYEVGKRVYPDKFNPRKNIVCAAGIHFFLLRKRAEEY